MTRASPIRRGFVDLPHGQMHYRTAGETGAPLVLFHASPGSSRQLVSLIEDFAGEARVYSPDTPGNGDSVPLGGEAPDIATLARAALEFLDAAGLERVRLYGSHTGAAIAAELAILAPERVDRVILDGVSLMKGEELADVLENYAHPFEPDLDGAYLIRIFQFCRDQHVFFPWYNRTMAGRRDCGLGTAADLHAWVTEVMKAATTYHVNYHAAFRWPADERLLLLDRPVLMTSEINDPLDAPSRMLTGLLPQGRFVELLPGQDPAFRAHRHAAFAAFLAEG